MKNQLLIATNNPSKVREIAETLKDLDLEVISLLDFKKCHPELVSESEEPPEDGETFEENARIKADFWCKQTDLPTLADDSGIFVEALPGELGVRTVRFGKGPEASDEEWLDYFLERMEGAENRKAKFVCVLAFAQPNEEIHFFHGEVNGVITEKPEAPLLPRIPLSSVFRANGASKVFATMSEAEKAQWSHRGRALLEAKQNLKELLK